MVGLVDQNNELSISTVLLFCCLYLNCHMLILDLGEILASSLRSHRLHLLVSGTMGALSIVIVPAASAVPLIYERVIDGVVANGYDSQVLHIPSVGLVGNGIREGSPPTMYDDAAFVAACVNDLADAGRDILLVMHSYGGTAGTQSAQRLSKSERQKQGKNGGIVDLAYMTCLVPELGKPASSRATTPPKDAKPLMAMGVGSPSDHPKNFQAFTDSITSTG